MYKAFLIKYSEIGTKGNNKYKFINALKDEITRVLKKVSGNFNVYKEQGRILIDAEEYDYDETIESLKKVFGIAAICPVILVEDKDFENIKKHLFDYVKLVYGEKKLTFKVEARRADKNYPLTSMEICAKLGDFLLNEFSNFKVDVHKPDIRINIEIRKKVYIYSEIIVGQGGMPLGTNGKAMLLLSGGIDSPVAGYMIGRRGVNISAVYFHAPPYTSDRAKQKVIDLAELVSKYTGSIKLHIVNFTDIQLYIYDKCPHDELTIIMRRYMMRIAQELAKEDGCQSLITGESIGQVASQTMESLTVTNEVCDMPVFRPLIGFDKQEIIKIAEKINTFETSILPFEDCCTIFVAKHPVTKPVLKRIKFSEQNLNDEIDELVQSAIANEEIIEVE